MLERVRAEGQRGGLTYCEIAAVTVLSVQRVAHIAKP
jgi:hypothetical protein